MQKVGPSLWKRPSDVGLIEKSLSCEGLSTVLHRPQALHSFCRARGSHQRMYPWRALARAFVLMIRTRPRRRQGLNFHPRSCVPKAHKFHPERLYRLGHRRAPRLGILHRRGTTSTGRRGKPSMRVATPSTIPRPWHRYGAVPLQSNWRSNNCSTGVGTEFFSPNSQEQFLCKAGPQLYSASLACVCGVSPQFSTE
jgi:hypothetical protein